MSSKLNYEKLNRERKTTYIPSARSQPATQKQIDYIIGLAYQKGQPKPRLPRTKRGASDLIERLLELPDQHERRSVRLATSVPKLDGTRTELVSELRARFPALTPMTVNSIIQLCVQVDELGMYFFFSELIEGDAPTELEELVPYILREFTEWCAPVSSDESMDE